MAYNITINKSEQFIRFDLINRLTQSDIDSAIEVIEKVQQKQSLKSILCDQSRLEVRPIESVGFLTAKRLTKAPFLGLKIAIVRNDERKEHLFEFTANLRAGRVKVFGDEEKAKIWLDSE